MKKGKSKENKLDITRFMKAGSKQISVSINHPKFIINNFISEINLVINAATGKFISGDFIPAFEYKHTNKADLGPIIKVPISCSERIGCINFIQARAFVSFSSYIVIFDKENVFLTLDFSPETTKVYTIEELKRFRKIIDAVELL